MTDERLERMIAGLLRAGVLLSALIVLVGGAWWLAGTGRAAPAYDRFHSEPDQLRHVSALLKSLSQPTPESVIELGLLLLILTPIARVALAWLAFVQQRDWTYVALTSVVLGILIYTLVLPFGASPPPHATGLRSTPTPSTSTSTMSPGASRRVAPGVPVKMRSPGSRVTQRLIQLTMVAQSKMKSAVRSS